MPPCPHYVVFSWNFTLDRLDHPRISPPKLCEIIFIFIALFDDLTKRESHKFKMNDYKERFKNERKQLLESKFNCEELKAVLIGSRASSFHFTSLETQKSDWDLISLPETFEKILLHFLHKNFSFLH